VHRPPTSHWQEQKSTMRDMGVGAKRLVWKASLHYAKRPLTFTHARDGQAPSKAEDSY
jgi:hypothetical protein